MKLTLINNAIDSLQIAMKTYHRWNNNYYKWNNKNEENWGLKITVEFLHNAIELLVKAILLKIDDQSIYCDRQEEIIEEARKEVVRKNILLEEYLIKNDKIKTCSYEEVLEKYFKINSEYPNRAKICLKRLGTYRNRIMHFGIDADENGDFFDLLAVIHESFNIILIDNFYEDLLKVDEYFEYNDVVDILEPLAFMFVNIFLAFVIQRKILFRKWYVLLIAVMVNIVLYQKGGTIKDNIRIYAILLVVLLLRYLVSGYNYAEIETNQVKAGMILSVATVLEFQKSRVKGLPVATNEDMSTRLSEEEADAIRRWEQSKYGKEKIVIVRKIPFAIFITSGSVIFLLIRLFM